MTTPNTAPTKLPSEDSQDLLGPLSRGDQAMLDDLDHGADLLHWLMKNGDSDQSMKEWEKYKAKQRISQAPQK